MDKVIELHLNGTITTHTDLDEVEGIVSETLGTDWLLEQVSGSKYGFFPTPTTPMVGYFEIKEV